MLVKLKLKVRKHWAKGESSFVFDISSNYKNTLKDISNISLGKHSHKGFNFSDNSVCTSRWIERKDYIEYLTELRNFLDGEAYN